MRLAGKVAYVTGGGRGIGQGIVTRLAEAGADIAVADINLQSAKEVAEQVRSLGRRAHAIRVDVTRRGEVEDMVAETESALGRLDITVNCAGVVSATTVAKLEEDEWDRVMDVNAKGVFLCCKASLPALQKAGGGSIINVASVAGKVGYADLAHYCASKFAVVGFTNALAKEVAKDNITVNAICPGIVRTHMWEQLLDARQSGNETRDATWQRVALAPIPTGRAQTPEDMGDMAVYLACAPNLTGQAINLDGGMTWS